MSEERSISLPSGWEINQIEKPNSTFTHRSHGLTVIVTGKSRRRDGGQGQESTRYIITAGLDWFAEDTAGDIFEDIDLSAVVDTWDEALAVAQEFMVEFNDEFNSIDPEHIEAIHESVNDPEYVDALLTGESAVEAFTDVAGYSDELLLSVLEGTVNEQYHLVAHRDGDTITPVAGNRDIDLHTIHGVFPLDPDGISHILEENPPIVHVVHLGKYSVYRIIFGNTRETDIVVPRGTEVISPTFETMLSNVLEEKW